MNVKPRLKFDGTPVATATASIGMGRTHDSDMQFIQPAGDDNVQPWVENSITAGNTQAIAFNTFLDVNDDLFFGSGSSQMSFLEQQLHSTATDYLARCNSGIDQTGRLLRAVTTQDISEAIVESSVAVTTSWLGNPITFEWTGLTVDADRRIIGTFPVDGDDTKEVPLMLLSGYDGSIMENRVFEDIYGQQAVSTVKILELSNDAGIPVYRITPSQGIPSGFNQPGLVTAINTALSNNHHVIIPRDAITVGEWHGTGYIDLDPATGAAGYIISGGISGRVSTNGGATVDVWLINLACVNPWLPITGTITPDGFSSGDTVCADGTYIAYTLTLHYFCGFNPRTFGPTSHQIPIKKNEIVRRYGPGQYTIRIRDTWVSAVNFLLLPYDKFTTTQKTICWQQDGKLDAKALLTADSCRDDNLVNWEFIEATGSATINASGLVTFGNGGGHYRIQVSPKDGIGCGDILTLDIIKLEFKPELQDKYITCWQQNGTFDAKALLTPESNQEDYLVNWTISGSPSATISASGEVTFGSGPGTYTVKVAGKGNAGCFDTLTLTLVGVESLLPDKGDEIDDGDGNPDTKTFVVCVSTTPGEKVTVTATSTPAMEEADLPACWDLNGGTGSGKLQRTLDQTVPKEEVFTCLEKETTVIVRSAVDMTVYRPTTRGPTYNNPFQRRAVPDDLEEAPGAGIRINGDSENPANENDLIEVQLDVTPFLIPSGLTYVLKRNNSNIKVWDSQTMGAALLDSGTEATITISSSPMSIWVENPSGGTADLELIARSGTTDVYSDKIHFYPFSSVVVFFEGEFGVPSDPPGDGISTLALAAYTNGYDVHVYDEPDIHETPNTEDTAFAEIDSAVENRGVTAVAVIGYSHGGGSAYRISERMDADATAFNLAFTAYIDAITQPLFDFSAEGRRPVGSAFHVNYYQVAQWNDAPLFLDGGPNTPAGAGFEDNVDDPTVTESHTTIDNALIVQDGIRTRLFQEVNR